MRETKVSFLLKTSREYPLITGSTYKNILAFLAFLEFLAFLQILHKAEITSRSSRSSFLGNKILGGATNRNSKIGLHYDIRDIPISLHAKFQGNRTIRLGEKR